MAEGTHPGGDRRLQDRLAAGFLLVLMTLGCGVMWIGAPAGSLWLAGELTESATTHLLIALPAALGAIIVCASALFRLNRLYLRVTLGPTMMEEEDEDEDEDEEEGRWMHGPLEPLLVGTLVIAVITLFVWFLFVAENPQLTA